MNLRYSQDPGDRNDGGRNDYYDGGRNDSDAPGGFNGGGFERRGDYRDERDGGAGRRKREEGSPARDVRPKVSVYRGTSLIRNCPPP